MVWKQLTEELCIHTGKYSQVIRKHKVVFKQANLQWIPSGTCMDMILVMFKLEKSAGLRLIKTMVAFWFLNGWSSEWASERVRDKVNKWVSCFLWFQLQYGCNDSRKSCVSGRWQAWVSSFKLIEPSFKVTAVKLYSFLLVLSVNLGLLWPQCS